MTGDELKQFKFEVAERAAIIAESQGEIPNIEGIAEEMTRYVWKEKQRIKSYLAITSVDRGVEYTTITVFEDGTTETKTELVPYPKEREKNEV